MREIVFRGKRTDTGEWVCGDLFYKDGLVGKEDDHFYILNADMMGISEREVIPETVGEYTRLIDKKGVKIFEGDVVSFGGETGVISFADACFWITREEDYAMELHTTIGQEDLSVIRNIHDKPELVPQGKEQPAAGVNICDRCGRVMDNDWEVPGMPGVGGNCTYCGDDLCAECAGTWSDHGEFKRCAVPY